MFTASHVSSQLRLHSFACISKSSTRHTQIQLIPESSHSLDVLPCLRHTDPTEILPHFIAIMCEYYAHAFICKHVTFTFARFCGPANLIQTPCSRRKVWHTFRMDQPCEECWTWFPDRVYGGPRRTRKADA